MAWSNLAAYAFELEKTVTKKEKLVTNDQIDNRRFMFLIFFLPHKIVCSGPGAI